jgi:ribosomal protein L31E
MAKEFKEKTITVNLRKAFEKPDTKRAICAKNMLIVAVKKETRLKDVRISNKVNEAFWARGRGNCPRRITVKIVAEKGMGMVLLPDEKYEAKKEKKADGKKETPKQAEAAPKEEAKAKTTEKTETKTEAKKETKPKAKKEETK